MKRSVSILFSSAGRRVELMRCFTRAAQSIGIDVRCVAADMDPDWSPACQVADKAYKVPRCTDQNFVPEILDISRKESIRLVIPTIDTELLTFSNSANTFAESGVRICVPDPHFVTMARDKAATASQLRSLGIAVPDTWSVEEARELPGEKYPLLAKPRDGSCSVDIKTMQSRTDLTSIQKPKETIIQEVCRGKELTVNCYYKADGGFVAAIPHYRKFVRGGEVCFAETVKNPAMTEIGQTLASAFPALSGVICFQAFQGNGQPKVIEINARFGGGYPVADHAGGHFAKWLLQEATGSKPEYTSAYQVGLRMLRYDAAVFVSPASSQ